MRRVSLSLLILVGALSLAAACGGKTPPVVAPTPPPGAAPDTTPAQPTTRQPPPPPAAVPEPPAIITPEPEVMSDPLANMDTDEINRQAPLAPVFFAYDSDAIDEEGQRVLAANAEVLKKYATWSVTVEGHCDERGTAEYNLALGERRALAAKAYLISLGISADRLRTVSYGEEFPFNPEHTEAAYGQNRRGHFVVTSK